MVVTDLHDYMGLLDSVYMSCGEAASSLWNVKMARPISHASMFVEMFCSILAVLRFDNHETRTVCHVTDKLAAIRDVWDKWVEQLPLL